MGEIPALYKNREMLFDPDMLEKIKFLNYKAGKQGLELKERFSSIVNDALREFLAEIFKKLGIEHYIDLEAIESKKRYEKMMEEQASERENRRLLQLAKLRIMEREIEKIKKEEKESGKKIESPVDIKRRLFNYKI